MTTGPSPGWPTWRARCGAAVSWASPLCWRAGTSPGGDIVREYIHPRTKYNIICSPNVEYLGVMAWAAAFQWIEDKHGPGDLVEVASYHL